MFIGTILSPVSPYPMSWITVATHLTMSTFSILMYQHFQNYLILQCWYNCLEEKAKQLGTDCLSFLYWCKTVIGFQIKLIPSHQCFTTIIKR